MEFDRSLYLCIDIDIMGLDGYLSICVNFQKSYGP